MLSKNVNKSGQLQLRWYNHISFSTSIKRNYAATSETSQDYANFELNKNSCGIQQLSTELHKQLFPKRMLPGPTPALTKIALKYLEQNELLGKPCSVNEPINLKLPLLQGNNINHHFQNLGLNSAEKYTDLVENLCKLGLTPLPKPDHWVFKSGWTRYAPNEEPTPVDYPLENELVFDTEVMYKKSPYPIMATCLSPLAWYSWCSPYLTGDSKENSHLIPLATDKRECIIVGHNVSFDRARVLEEYNLKQSKAFFLDTMSLHVSVSGMCSRQRGTWMKYKKNVREKIKAEENSLAALRDMIQNEELRYTLSNNILDEESADDDNDVNSALREDPWMKSSSMNKLSDVAELYCGIKMEKQLRDHFATEDINEIRDLFQELMTYCADDVIATYHVLEKVYPLFKSVVPHPVSFAALRHINSSFLPTSSDWENYIHRCEDMYQKSKVEVEAKLHEICKKVVGFREKADEKTPPWKNNPWLSQLDWTIKPIKMTKAGVPYKNQKLPGYPEWYKKLVVKNELNLTMKSRYSPLLLQILWENKPIFWTDYKGWCFIVDNKEIPKFEEMKYVRVDPNEVLSQEAPAKRKTAKKKSTTDLQDEDEDEVNISESKNKTKKATKSKASKSKQTKKSKKATKEPDSNVENEISFAESDPIVRENLINLIETGKTLFKIPHENGESSRVTSLITKPFLRYFEEGILTSSHELAKKAFETNISNSYWVSSRERIMNQFVVYESNLKKQKNKGKKPHKTTNKKELGFIIPQIISMGTITRRAVEKTWLTASNAKKTRLGSELKSLIQAPPGYCFVGADVDSEELWIASLAGDSVFRLHGGTALGWMTLEGTKNAGTDLHSKTAKILGISRNEAKVFNYGRIYGAGAKFATSLLKKFNPSITEEKAAEVAKQLYAETKGKGGVVKLAGSNEKVRIWYGGSESAVFNQLETIAEQDNPKTPVLGAGITAALKRTNLNSNSFLPSRINWAIQSSGVDYLHLLLISMEHLCKVYGIDARLAITVHDEVRYLTKEENKYKCAMLLQIANLWTRAMFCFQLGIENIPQSCAFFSSVDIDFVLRKEVDFDCITPSNPNPIPHGENLDIYKLLEIEEVKEMLESTRDKLLLNKNFDSNAKLVRPVEELNKKMDTSTKLQWLQLQICKTDNEFKKQKRQLFNSLDHMNLEKASKKLLKEDSKFEAVVCDGLFATENPPDVLDAGLVLEQNWDVLVGKSQGQEKKKRKSSHKKNTKTVKKSVDEDVMDMDEETHVSQFIDMIGTKALDATSKKIKSNKPSKTNPVIRAAKKEPANNTGRETAKTDKSDTLTSPAKAITLDIKPMNCPFPAPKPTLNTVYGYHHHEHLTDSELMEIHNS